MLRSVRLVVVYLFVFMVFTLGQMASADEQNGIRPHLTFNLGSHHLNATRDFNEVNPGIGIGITGPSGLGRSEFGLELGQYKNSLNNQSYYVMGSLDTEIARLGPDMALRLGGFAGLARYPSNANKFKDHGVPTFGDWVLAAGLQSTLRINDTYDLRLRVMPAGSVADALITAQISIRF